jgi:hypothetical protein
MKVVSLVRREAFSMSAIRSAVVQQRTTVTDLRRHGRRRTVAATPDSDEPIVVIPPDFWNGNSGHHPVDGFFGSPHLHAMPIVVSDGEVRLLTYGVESRLLPKHWDWNDVAVVPLL